MKILIMGLSGSGKTTLATELAGMIRAVLFNADDVREHLGCLGFTPEARIKQAHRMKYLCDTVSASGHHVIADFICPTDETRAIFNADYTVFVDRTKESQYKDTDQMFEPPEKYNIRITSDEPPREQALKILNDVVKLDPS